MDSIMSANGLPELDLRVLVALRAVAELRSFGRAAEQLGYTQSAISQQIAALERIVGEPVFDRPGGPKPVVLTRAGELLLVHANAILDRVRAAEADLASYRAGRLGRLAIGTFQSVSVRILPEVLRRLRAERPDLEITLLESDDQDDLVNAVSSGELDLSFVIGPATADDHEVTAFADDPFVVISPVDQALVPEGELVPVELLATVPFIGQTPNACALLIEGGLFHAGVEPKVVFRTGDNSAVQAMVRSGMGHSVMPLLALDVDDPGVVIRGIDPPIPYRTIGVAVPTRRHRAPAVGAFLEITEAVCSDLVPALGHLVT
jgi:DNA-binding transcriptional LysR family regulator